jgi:hypothetical protein
MNQASIEMLNVSCKGVLPVDILSVASTTVRLFHKDGLAHELTESQRHR